MEYAIGQLYICPDDVLATVRDVKNFTVLGKRDVVITLELENGELIHRHDYDADKELSPLAYVGAKGPRSTMRRVVDGVSLSPAQAWRNHFRGVTPREFLADAETNDLATAVHWHLNPLARAMTGADREATEELLCEHVRAHVGWLLRDSNRIETGAVLEGPDHYAY